VCLQPENKINQKSHSKNEKLEHGYEKQVVITIQGDTLIPTSKIDVFGIKDRIDILECFVTFDM
jgi:hypothetical protein